MYVSNERSYDKEFSINLRYSENLDGELLLNIQLVQKKSIKYYFDTNAMKYIENDIFK